MPRNIHCTVTPVRVLETAKKKKKKTQLEELGWAGLVCSADDPKGLPPGVLMCRPTELHAWSMNTTHIGLHYVQCEVC